MDDYVEMREGLDLAGNELANEQTKTRRIDPRGRETKKRRTPLTYTHAQEHIHTNARVRAHAPIVSSNEQSLPEFIPSFFLLLLLLALACSVATEALPVLFGQTSVESEWQKRAEARTKRRTKSLVLNRLPNTQNITAL